MALPFALDRNSPSTLVDQVVNGIRDSIRRGEYRVGDRLPTWREIAKECGVSERVPRDAMARLVRDGLVVAHRRIGCTVAAGRLPRQWKGTVLAVQDVASAMSFSSISAEMGLTKTLSRAGYALVPVTADGVPMRSTRSLVEHILSFKADFVLMLWDSRPFAGWLSRKGIPFAGYVDYGMANCVGVLPWFDFSKAIARFVRHCRRAGVRRVLQVGHVIPELFDALPALQAAGLQAERWIIPCPDKSPARVRSAGEQAFTVRLKKDRSWLPDVILFTDDYLASGAMTALAYAGLRSPGNIRFATFATTGNEPAFPVAPTFFRADCEAHGVELARSVIEFLRTRTWPLGRETVATYEPGTTFPVC